MALEILSAPPLPSFLGPWNFISDEKWLEKGLWSVTWGHDVGLSWFENLTANHEKSQIKRIQQNFFYFDGLDEDTYVEVSQLLKDFAVEVFAQKPSDASLVTGS